MIKQSPVSRRPPVPVRLINRSALGFIRISLLVIQHPSRMQHIKHSHRNNHHSPIEPNKVRLVRNEITIPSLRQLDRTIDTPNIDTDDGKYHRPEQGKDRAGPRLQQILAHNAADEVDRANDEYGYREELEDNSSDHDVRASCGVAADRIGFSGGHAAADGLDDEGDYVAGAEDP